MNVRRNDYGGLFVAIDGPNGVGKSTLIKSLADELESKKYDVYVTKEPTNTELGVFLHKVSEYMDGYTLACLVAADRYQHLKNEVIPQLKAGKIVITDRYVLSSLILQRIDEVDEKFIIEINKHIVAPDLQFAIFADAEIIKSRLNQRNYRTRFENDPKKELEFLKTGLELLKKQKIKTIEIDNSLECKRSVDIITNHIFEVFQ